MSLPESSWDDLLQFIDEGRVIPIVGSELLRATNGNNELSFDCRLAHRLAERLEVAAEDLPEQGALNHVACLYLKKSTQNRRERIYSQLRLIINDVHVPIPEPLRKLAEIERFQLYVTMTADSLLRDALADVRKSEPDVIVYSPGSNDTSDLTSDMSHLKRPTVFHLLGRVSSTPDYVVTDEDTLEFLYALQSGDRPSRLFDELRSHHLLLIGCGYPDWLARFFIRMTKGTRLSLPSTWREFVADKAIACDRELGTFLEHFSYGTQIFSSGDGVQFVNELAERYQARHLHDPQVEQSDLKPSSVESMLPGAVFVSYARQDRGVAKTFSVRLKDLGADVWIDSELQAGEHWDGVIQRNIRQCSYFVPIISSNTEARDEGYFRKEWRWAADRALGTDDSVPFIIPILIDETQMPDAKVPDIFRQKQSFRLPMGEPTSAFKNRIIELLCAYRKRERRLP